MLPEIMRVVFFLILILVILAVSPILIFISLLLWVTQGHPIIFRQKRVGFGGRTFIMYKFRTMKHGAEQKQKELTPLNEAHGPVFKIHNDPRYTPVGKFLAHTGLDELPQFFNILHGDMAFIGPRPLPLSEAAKLTAWQKKRHSIKPGMISPWILEGYHKQPFDVWMKSDIAYIKRKSVPYDLRLAIWTIGFLLWLFIQECVSRS